MFASVQAPARRLLQLGLVAALLAPITASAGDTTKHARKSDVASRYTLEDDGDLFRTVGKHKCQVTNRVLDIKVSQHPDDAAVLYFLRKKGDRADLYVLHNAEKTGQCPKASKKRIASDVAKVRGKYKYSVVPSQHTEIVAVALTDDRRLLAWDDDSLALSKNRIEDYRLYNKYGVKGAPFRRYAVFALHGSGRVLKVDGEHPDRSKYDRRHKYDDLKQFWAKNLDR